MIVLYRLLRGFNCKILVDLPFSKTLKENLNNESFSLYSLLSFYFPSSNLAFLFQWSWLSLPTSWFRRLRPRRLKGPRRRKPKGSNKTMLLMNGFYLLLWPTRVPLRGCIWIQGEGSSKWPRVESVLIVIFPCRESSWLSFLEGEGCFSLEEGLQSWGSHPVFHAQPVGPWHVEGSWPLSVDGLDYSFGSKILDDYRILGRWVRECH